MKLKLRGEEEIDVSVGMKLYLSNVIRNKGDNQFNLTELTVTKLGRKWITLVDKNKYEYQFDNRGDQNSQYSHNTLYISIESYREKEEARRLNRCIKEKIDRSSIPVHLVIKIAKILEIESYLLEESDTLSKGIDAQLKGDYENWGTESLHRLICDLSEERSKK